MANKKNQEALDNIEDKFYEVNHHDDCNIILEVDTLQTAIDEREELKNELCLHCGKYKNEHLGACKGCKWYE